MAIFYDKNDDIFYGTNAERLAENINRYPAGSNFYETDTKAVYKSNGTAWIAL